MIRNILRRSAARGRIPVTSATCASRLVMPIRLATSTRYYSNGNEGGPAMTNGVQIPKEVLELPLQQYHQHSESFLEGLFDNLEELSENYPQHIPEVEYSHGVMSLTVAGVGTYVINKQPPNKQIWLSSPNSGPNRFDLYKGEWISLRNNETLLSVLDKELHDALPNDAEFKVESDQ